MLAALTPYFSIARTLAERRKSCNCRKITKKLIKECTETMALNYKPPLPPKLCLALFFEVWESRIKRETQGKKNFFSEILSRSSLTEVSSPSFESHPIIHIAMYLHKFFFCIFFRHSNEEWDVIFGSSLSIIE